jgi:hypothetical protein
MKRRQFFRFTFLAGAVSFISQLISSWFRPAQAQTWQKLTQVTSVNGQTGAVSLSFPTTTGGGASGTWSINITGSAGSASTATTATTASTANAVATGNSYQMGSLGVGTTASGTAGELRTTNNITAYFSDYRLKENIRPIDGPLEKIMQISGVYYNSNRTAEQFGYTDKSLQVGVIAQEVLKVLPEVIKPAPFDSIPGTNGSMISKSGENYMTVQYEKIIPLLIESIKELNAKVQELESRR